MAIPLPDKSDKENRKNEEARRKDINVEGVAQEAIDCVEELRAANRSPREAFIEFGYDPRVTKKALKERDRIRRELGKTPSKDVPDTFLKVSDVKTKYNIPEFVPAPEPEEKPAKGEEAPAPFVVEG